MVSTRPVTLLAVVSLPIAVGKQALKLHQRADATGIRWNLEREERANSIISKDPNE